jgi:hypothetical protein
LRRWAGVNWAGADYPGLSVDQLNAVRREKARKYPDATPAQINAAIKAVLRPGSLRMREVEDVEREAMRASIDHANEREAVL